MFSEDCPIAWSFHRNTCRWQRNIPPQPPEQVSATPPFKEYAGAKVIRLPVVDLPGMALNEAILKRHSCRDYADTALSLADLSALLRGGYGIKGVKTSETFDCFERAVPSGGALYSLELYLLVRNVENVQQGIYHYSIYPPLLEEVHAIPFSNIYISQLFMNQPYVAQSSVVLIVTSVLQRNMKKYGDRGYRYIFLEAGHLFQNINLLATALGLGTVNLGGFFDDEMANLLKIDTEEEVPLYGMAIGVPAET